MNVISVFSGIGGPDLAAEWLGWNVISHTEWNPFCQQILKYYWPNADSYADITKTDYTKYLGITDILVGGFPCQGFSLAGKRLGTDDDRYLWPEMRRTYQECKPRIIIGENVTGLLSMEDKSGVWNDVFPKVEGRTIVRTLEADHYEAVYSRQAKMLIDSICKDLEQDGYEAIPVVIPAAAVGAPHQRDRVWIIAYANGDGYGCNNRAEQTGCAPGQSESLGKQRQRLRGNIRGIGTTKNAANADSAGQSKQVRSGRRIVYGTSEKFAGRKSSRNYSKGNWEQFPTQSPVCNGNDGFSARLDTETVFEGFNKSLSYSKWRNESIKAGGNAIVPQVIYEIFKMIDQLEKL